MLQDVPQESYQVLQDVSPEPYQVLQDNATVNPDMRGDCMFPYDSDDEPAQVFYSPGDGDTYFMDMATGRYMEGNGDGYVAPHPNPDWNIPVSEHVRALTAGPDQASAPEPDDVDRDQNGWSQQDHDAWNYQHGASRPPPPTLEQNLKWVSGSGGGYPQDQYSVTQQSVGEPSILLLRIGQGPSPRCGAPVPPPRGVHISGTLSLHTIPEVKPKGATKSKPRVRFKEDTDNPEEWTTFGRPKRGCPQ